MAVVEGRFLRVSDQLPHCAIVELDVDTNAGGTHIADHCTGDGWVAQGYLENASAKGYDDWKAGARVGVEFALQVANVTANVVIRRITGMLTDTNPSIVAAAAANAIWDAVEFSPSSEAIACMESVVFQSWPRDHDYVPTVAELLGRTT